MLIALAVVYFLFLIIMFVLVVVVTIVIQHLYLRADSVPFTPMPTWVSKRCYFWPVSSSVLEYDSNCVDQDWTNVD